MPRVLLVSYTHKQPLEALRLQRKLSPSMHLELGVTRPFPHGSVTAAVDLLTREERDRILTDGIAWLKKVPKQPVNAGVFAQTLLHRSVSLWWWLESPFWFGDPRDPAFAPLANLLEAAEALRAAIESSGCDRVAFVSDVRPMVSLIVEDVANHFGLRVSGATSASSQSHVVDALRPRIMRWLFLRRRKLGKRVERWEVAVLLISHLNALRPVGDVREDVYLGRLREELAVRNVPHAVCYVNSLADARPRLRVSYPQIPKSSFLLEQAISENPAREVGRAYRGIVESWSRAQGHVIRASRWRNIPLTRTLTTRFGEVVRRHAPTGVYYTAAFEELLGGWEPEVAVITNETGYAGRAAVAACQRLSIRSVGVQHGLISPQHIEYINDAELMDRELRWSCPYPDVTILDGNYYQRVLAEVGAYPNEATLVLGQMRYDAGDTELSRNVERIPNRIVVATHPFHRERWSSDVLTACRDLGQILIKPHPLEDAEFYVDLVDRGIAGARVIRDVDLIRLLRSTAVLVTGFSTTVVEAAVAECPSVIYNPWGTREPIPFVELGGALRAESAEELRGTVASVLRDEDARRRLATKRSSFLEQFAYARGIGSTRRIADKILRAAP